MKTPTYFLEKIRRAAPHKWGWFMGVVYISPMPYVLYRGSDGNEVMQKCAGGYIEFNSYKIEFYNPSSSKWEELPTEENCCFHMSEPDIKTIEKIEFCNVDYQSFYGVISFDIKGWLHKHISPEFIVGEDFSYDKEVSISGKKIALADRIYGKSYVEGKTDSPHLVFEQLHFLEVTIQNLKEYFEGLRLPAAYDTIFDGIKNGTVDKASFLNWIQGAKA